MSSGQSICKNDNSFKLILCVSQNARESTCTTYKYFMLLTASKCTLWKTLYHMSYNSPKAFQLFYWILAFFSLLQIPHIYNNQGNHFYIVLNSMWIIIILVLPTHVQTNMPLNNKTMLCVHTRTHAHYTYTHVHECLHHLLLLHITTIKKCHYLVLENIDLHVLIFQDMPILGWYH
jgi:hypothetical protein